MTNAYLQRWLSLGSVLLWWLLAWHWASSHPWLAVGCFLAPALITPTLIAIQCIVSCIVSRESAVPRARVGGWLQAWWRETRIAWQIFSWWQPFFRAALADQLHRPASASADQRGVVLVHGFFCNRAFWTLWMRRLRREGRVFVAVDLEPAFGSIDAYVQTIECAVRQVSDATGQPPVVVGHSMGGLAIRAWLRSVGGLQRVHQVITIGTPHHGTALARYGHGTNGAQMRQRSRWLEALGQVENATHTVLERNKFVCFYSNCDNIVFPVSSAMLQGADNRLVVHRGHVDLAFAPVVQAACWDAMGASES